MTITYPNPLPFKLRILKGLTDALKEITVANGYQTDLADDDTPAAAVPTRVFRGRAWFGDSDPLPMISVLEGVAPADEVAEAPAVTAAGEFNWSLMVQGFVKDDPVNPTDPAYVLLADVRRRLAIEKVRKKAGDPTTRDIFGLGLNKHLIDITIGPGVVRPADDISSLAYFWCSLTLRIVDNASTPYA